MGLCFQFSEEQERFRHQVRDLARKEIAPFSPIWDREERIPSEGISKMGEAGLLGIIGSKHLGGQGKDYITLGIAVEEIARLLGIR